MVGEAEIADAVVRILHLIESNKAYRSLYIDLIRACSDEIPDEEAIALCESWIVAKNQIQSPESILGSLVSKGALLERIYVDDELYEGSLQELQTDEQIPESAAIEFTVQATEAGLTAANIEDEALSFRALVDEQPNREGAFRYVLELCAQPGGKTTRELQDALKEADLLETEAARGIDALHASYFTGSLESKGLLAWEGKRWVTSDKGRSVLGI